MLRFSIIVPVYKVEKYLPQCIESVLSQSFSDYELILVDDGSPDKCPEICENYAKKSDKIKVIHKNNSGVSDARNCGIAGAKGEYLLFLDADDFLNKESLTKIAGHIEKYGKTDIVFASYLFYTEENNRFYQNHKDYYFEGIKNGNSIEVLADLIKTNTVTWSAFSSVFKRPVILENNILFKSKITVAEDMDFFMNAAISSKSFSTCNIDICSHRLFRSGSAMTDRNKDGLYWELYVLKTWFDHFFNDNITLEQKKILCNFFSMHFSMKITIIILFDKKDRAEIIKYITDNEYILHYPTNAKNRIKSIVIKIFGVKNGILLLKFYQRFIKIKL